MPQIDVDFEVWKALTLRRMNEDHTYNSILREMLGLSESTIKSARRIAPAGSRGRILGGRSLPESTELRAKYKGNLYYAAITNGRLVNQDGIVFGSASAAARAVTGNSVNGLTFWEVKRPSDEIFRPLVALPRDA